MPQTTFKESMLPVELEETDPDNRDEVIVM